MGIWCSPSEFVRVLISRKAGEQRLIVRLRKRVDLWLEDGTYWGRTETGELVVSIGSTLFRRRMFRPVGRLIIGADMRDSIPASSVEHKLS